MRKNVLLLAIFVCGLARAQQPAVSTESVDTATGLYKMGMEYFQGKTVAADIPKAVQYFRQAAALGEALSLYQLGYMMLTRTWFAFNEDSVVFYLNKSGDAGYTMAYLELGLMYRKGGVVKQNIKKATLYFEKGAAGGCEPCKHLLASDAEGLNLLGISFYAPVLFPSDSCIFYYKQAAALGHAGAAMSLGSIYYNGLGVAQDFVASAKYYVLGAELGLDASANSVAYCYFKGLGLPQNYDSAFMIYQRLAQKGDANAMYFLGLCYQNGFGTTSNENLATQWFEKANAVGEPQSKYALMSGNKPFNAYLRQPELATRVESLESSTKPFASGVTWRQANISGQYTGQAIYYDFSRQYAEEIVPIKLTIQLEDGWYTGTWTEGSKDKAVTAPIKASIENDSLIFDSSSHYIRYRPYNAFAPEYYTFKNAKINVNSIGDSTYLSGDINFYSQSRREPGQPMFILLRKEIKYTKNSENIYFNIQPNPATDKITVTFNLKEKSEVILQLFSVSGAVLQQKNMHNLTAGIYTNEFNVTALPSGFYIVMLSTGIKTETKTFIKR